MDRMVTVGDVILYKVEIVDIRLAGMCTTTIQIIRYGFELMEESSKSNRLRAAEVARICGRLNSPMPQSRQNRYRAQRCSNRDDLP
jgi:hypothetical protein